MKTYTKEDLENVAKATLLLYNAEPKDVLEKLVALSGDPLDQVMDELIEIGKGVASKD